MTPLSSMTKRYILKKDLPGNKAGTIFRWHKMTGGYAPELDNDSFNDDVLHSFPKEWVENDTDGFFEEEKPEFIFGVDPYRVDIVAEGGKMVAVLNEESGKYLVLYKGRPEQKEPIAAELTKRRYEEFLKNPPIYTEEQLEEAEKAAFRAAKNAKRIADSSKRLNNSDDLKSWDDLWAKFKKTKAFKYTLSKDIHWAFWRWIKGRYPKGVMFNTRKIKSNGRKQQNRMD